MSLPTVSCAACLVVMQLKLPSIQAKKNPAEFIIFAASCSLFQIFGCLRTTLGTRAPRKQRNENCFEAGLAAPKKRRVRLGGATQHAKQSTKCKLFECPFRC
jgi:hypothetical protein